MREATSQQQELDTWKDTCDRLTASVSRKENEIQTLSDRLLDMEDLVRNDYDYIQIDKWLNKID